MVVTNQSSADHDGSPKNRTFLWLIVDGIGSAYVSNLKIAHIICYPLFFNFVCTTKITGGLGSPTQQHLQMVKLELLAVVRNMT